MKTRDNLFKEVAEALGVVLYHRDLDGKSSDGFSFAIGLQNLPRPRGCEFRVRENLLSWTFDLCLDNFPGELLATLRTGYFERKAEVIGLLEALQEDAAELLFLVNEREILDIDDLENWSSLELRLRFRFKDLSESDSALRKALLGSFAILLELITDKSDEFEVEVTPGYEEGEKNTVLKNHYERSRINRALCLEWHGFECKACNLNMGKKYGPLGDGVIHVHHLEPVSQMEKPRVLNPKTDLVPLCPNCHAIVHRKNPPLTIPELRTELEQIKRDRE